MNTPVSEAREKAATPLTEFEVERWRILLATLMHDASLKTEIRWKQELRALATIDALRAQLKDLVNPKAWRGQPSKDDEWWLQALDRILKGGD